MSKTESKTATPTPWASGERINGDKSGIYTVAYETAHPQKVATVNDPGDVPGIVLAVNAHADLVAALQLYVKMDNDRRAGCHITDRDYADCYQAATSAIARAKAGL